MTLETQPMRRGLTLLDDAEMLVEEMMGRIYVVHVHHNVSKALLARALQVVWASPRWKQPWGLVIHIEEQATYDGDVRQHEMPPNDKRAVGTAVVTRKQLHRAIIQAIGLGYRMVSSFYLSAHDTVEQGVEAQRFHVERAERAHKPY